MIETGSEAPDFDLKVDSSTRVRLSDFRGRRNVLLVFHPFAFTAVCEEEALDLQENLPTSRARRPTFCSSPAMRRRRGRPGRRSWGSRTRCPRTSGRTVRLPGRTASSTRPLARPCAARS